jgi:hypothetical protein
MRHGDSFFDVGENSLTSTLVNFDSFSAAGPWLTWTIVAGILVLLVAALWVWAKGRPFAGGNVFRASRLSQGNRLLPTQVLITPSSVVHFTPRWIGRQEESIHMAHIASVKIQTGILLSDVLIETSGGANPVRCHGHRKRDAVQMKALIERFQNEYYKGGAPSPGSVGPSPSAR